jgi:uncharacterized protein with PIN domain
VSNYLFLADKTVGRLAKWLRLLGFDCAFDQDSSPRDLIDHARREGRILLTKNTHLVTVLEADRCLFIEGNRWQEQLKQVIKKYDLTIESKKFLSVCSICNSPLNELTREQARGLVPPYVFAKRQVFRQCPSCARIYWGGTHKERMIRQLQEILDTQSDFGGD